MILYRVMCKGLFEEGYFKTGRYLLYEGKCVGERIAEYCDANNIDTPPATLPDPTCDPDLRDRWGKSDYNHLYFGFENIAQLKRCFVTEEIRRMASVAGNQLATFTIADKYVTLAKDQVMFDLRKVDRASIVIEPLSVVDSPKYLRKDDRVGMYPVANRESAIACCASSILAPSATSAIAL